MWFIGMDYIDKFNEEFVNNVSNTKELKIKLEKVVDIQRFVSLASRYKNLDLTSGRYIVSASSLLGVFSLDLEKPINLCYPEEIDESIKKDFAQWIVED